MGVAIFFLLALIAAAIIAYPLLPGRIVAQAAPTVTDGEIERAVRDLRRARRTSNRDRLCPACGQGYQEGDRFCVRCGGALPQAQAADGESLWAPLPGRACPSCGSALREGDAFCARCGHRLAAEEVA